MSAAAASSAHLSAEDLSALKGFARFYGEHRATITARFRELAARSPRWADVGPGAVEDTVDHEDRELASQIAALCEGRWEPYFASMRARSIQYARAGIRYTAWFDLNRAFRDSLGEVLTRILQEDPARNLSRVLEVQRGVNVFFSLALEQIGEAYLQTTQQELARSEAMHRAMFEQSPLPMWTFDRETLRFVTVNEAALRHYGYTRDELAEMTIEDIRPAEDVVALRADLAKARGMADRQAWRHRKKDGTEIMVEVRGNDFALDGRPVRLVLLNDVTERLRAEEALRKTEEQLRHAQKMEAIGRLAGGVAHDFNNILTVVQNYACLLEDGTDPNDSRHEDAAEIRRAAERGSAITRQLLTMSRHGIVAPRALDVARLVDGFLPMLRRLVGDQVKIVTHCEKTPEVLVDPGQLEQVLMNLAVNARDAMPEGGRLTIECRTIEIDGATAQLHGLAPGPFVELAVTDTGTGIDAETQARIFEPFFTTKDATKGTGLGLAIAHGIVAQAGGRIAVYSEQGHGTTFRVQLPVAAGPRATASQEPTLDAPTTLPALRVLLVDDQPDVRTVAARILQDAGCSVLEAASAEEARTIFVRHDEPIDVVLLDVVLPDGRGDVLMHELRELRPTTTFVLMSGYSAGALSPSGAPPENLLPKPFSPPQLRAAVARASSGVARPSAPSTFAGRGTPYRALVADDDEALRRVIVRLLRKADFDVVDVDSGAKAIAALGTAAFDVIVSDVQMPDGDGLELLRAVRRVDLDVPVILMTGQPSVEAAAAAVEYGAFRYLVKPLDNAAFVTCVKHAARAHALARIRREAFRVTGAHTGVTDRAGLEVRFEQALDGMWMAFQPIVHASNGALFGAEALMRSAEPSLPTPPALLDAATQLGRLPHLGRRVRALASAALSQRADQLALFVNLHPDDLLDADLVSGAAPMTQLASRIILEVTERTALESSPQLTERIARLRELGFRLAVDDIGAGYSGLTSFAELTPEVVKIDMSLVRDVHKSALKQRTIAALCRLCHESGTLVVAEGVETLEERETLVGLGCDLLQGYLLGRPQRELP